MQDEDRDQILAERARRFEDDAERVQVLERGAIVGRRAGGDLGHIMSWRIWLLIVSRMASASAVARPGRVTMLL